VKLVLFLLRNSEVILEWIIEKFVKVCDWIHWYDILKKTFNNLKLYINNLKLFYIFYWMTENIKKIIYKKNE